MEIHKTNNRKKLIIIISVVMVVLAVAVAAVLIIWKPFVTPSIEQPGGTVKLSGPTKDEQKAGDNQKEEIAKREDLIEKSDQTTGLKQITPIVTFADQNGLNAYVSGIYEDGGICTAKMTKGSLSFEKSATSFKDATTTGCSPIDFSSTDFAEKGEWSLTLQYKSATSEGTSAVTKVRVN